MSTLTRAAAYTVRIAAVTGAAPCWPARPLPPRPRSWPAGNCGSSPAHRCPPRPGGSGPNSAAGRRQRRRRKHAGAAAGAGWGRPRQAPPRSRARALRSGPCPAGCLEHPALGTPAIPRADTDHPLDAPAGDVRQPARGSLRPLPGPALSSRAAVSSRAAAGVRSRAGACPCAARSGDVRACPAFPRIRVDLDARVRSGRPVMLRQRG